MMEETARKSEQMLNLVKILFNKQGETDSIANSIEELTGTILADEETIASAQAEIAEDGYFGVEQTSDRLIGFAKAISGGDPDKIELLRDAVIQGFEEAEEMWGGELPQISQDTFDATMSKFDDWAEESGVTLSEL